VYRLEEHHVAEQCDEFDAIYAGRLTTRFFRELFFYLPPREGDPQLADIPEDLSRYQVLVRTEYDETWKTYLEFLYPDDRSYLWITGRHNIEALMRGGVDVSLPRPITHSVELPSEEAREALIAEAEELGFRRGKLFSRVVGGEDTSLYYCATIVRDDPPDLPESHEVAMQVFDLVDKRGGFYEGWGASIGKADAELLPHRELVSVIATFPSGDHETGDEMTLAAFQRAGGDLEMPTKIVHRLSFKARDAAQAALEQLSARLEAVIENPFGGRWWVAASEEAVPALSKIAEGRCFADEVARRFGGLYEGWEAAVRARHPATK
jgi:hypothetical protein